jgi:hypothetical protein
MAAYTPLRASGEPQVMHARLELALQLARKSLARVADANIHDHDAMIDAAVDLHIRLGSLVAAVEAERGGAVMAVDRVAVIAEAMRLMESGEAVLPEAPGPLVIHDRLERGKDGTGRVGFVAFKTAQRIIAASGAAS